MALSQARFGKYVGGLLVELLTARHAHRRRIGEVVAVADHELVECKTRIENRPDTLDKVAHHDLLPRLTQPGSLILGFRIRRGSQSGNPDGE